MSNIEETPIITGQTIAEAEAVVDRAEAKADLAVSKAADKVENAAENAEIKAEKAADKIETEAKKTEAKAKNIVNKVIQEEKAAVAGFPIKFDLASQKPISQLSFQDILLWRNFYVTLAVFIMLHAAYILLEFYQFTVVTLVGRILQIQVIVCFLYIVGARFIKNASGSNQLPFSNFQVTKEHLQPYVDSLVDRFNLALTKYLDILLCKKPSKTIQFALVLQVVCWLGKKFSGFTFLFLLSEVALIAPFVYQWKQREIDALLEVAKKEINKQAEVVFSKLPPQVKDAFQTAKKKFE
ncbi:hypothetical protein AKO1_014630 [Acrasis kona]|uniref:Reticulon-like protein n=1 Tax=Acrasis kona TaxID=1008807 RepID=A0AAW2Z1W2_9EUKA